MVLSSVSASPAWSNETPNEPAPAPTNTAEPREEPIVGVVKQRAPDPARRTINYERWTSDKPALVQRYEEWVQQNGQNPPAGGR